jgi:hypothetical protein
MEITKMQEGLIQWFHYQEDREISFSRIENICIQLHEQYHSEKPSKNAKYAIFYPLIRFGIIEFYGNKKFGLSPSAVLYNKQYCLGINLPQNSIDLLNSFNIKEIFTSIYIFDYSKETIKQLIADDIPCNNFELSDILGQIESIKKIVENWNVATVFETNSYQYFNPKNEWVNQFNNQTIGLFRTENQSYARRLLKIENYKWLEVPNRNSHIDAFNIAVCWSLIVNDCDLKVSYNKENSQILIKNIYFPILLERLLFFNHCLIIGDFTQKNYHLQAKNLKLLNKLFNNKIKINE